MLDYTTDYANFNPVEFDVETTGLQPWSGVDEAFLWIFMDGDTPPEAIPFTPSGDSIPGYPGAELDRDANRERIQWWFDKAKKQGIRAWNTKFDEAFATVAGCFDLPGDSMWHDGMLVAHAIDERRSVALKAVASDLFGEEAADPQKRLKAWLTKENQRRSKTLANAEKARVGTLKVPNELAGEKYAKGDTLPDGSIAQRAGRQNKLRLANAEEKAAVIAEAEALLDPATGDYRRANYSHVPQEIMDPYAKEDVILTRKVCDVYATKLQQSPDLARVVEFERKAMDALFAIEMRGLPAQQKEYRRLEQEVVENLIVKEQRVRDLVLEGDPVIYAKELAGDAWGPDGIYVERFEDGTISYTGGAAHLSDFNPKSSYHIIAALKARKADLSHMSKIQMVRGQKTLVPFYKKGRDKKTGEKVESDGKYSADAQNLRAVDDDLALAMLEFRSEFKVLSTYVRPMIGRSYVSRMNVYKSPFISEKDSRIHANYRQVGARTGRMSCSDPNMQNQPRDDLRLRYNIHAEPGHVLITCDLTNIEMYLFAAYCGGVVRESRLLNAVQRNEDLHTLTAKMLQLRDRARAGGVVETARQQGKTFNFSKIYGGGLRTIKKSFRVDDTEARRMQQLYNKAYPEVSKLTALIETKLAEDGYVQDKHISGRRFRVAVADAYKATNYLVQGTAASLLKYAVTKLHEDGAPMVALVHDEIVIHCKEEDAAYWAKQVELRMTEYPTFKGIIPLAAEADIVYRWSDAKPLKDENGRQYYFDPEWANVDRRYLDEEKDKPLISEYLGLDDDEEDY